MKQELLPHILHRWHQQLLVILCFLKDVQLRIRSGVGWGGEKKKICTSAGMSASYTEGPFKRTLVPREQKMPEMKSYLLQPPTEETDLPPSLYPNFRRHRAITLTQPGTVHAPVCNISCRVDTKPRGRKRGGVASSPARAAASVRLDRHVNASRRDLHLGQEVTFPTNALPPKAVQKAQMCTNMRLFFFSLLETRGDASVIPRFHQAKRNSSTKSRRSRRG